MLHITSQTHQLAYSWHGAMEAIYRGHLYPQAMVKDLLLEGDNSLLSRAAFIEGMGWGVKSVSVIPDNHQRGLPSIHGMMVLFDPETGIPIATLDNAILTNLKTVADSLLGAALLAPKESRILLIVGAGSVAKTLVEGYSAIFPDLKQILIWNRTQEKAAHLANHFVHHPIHVTHCDDLAKAAEQADIISAATMTIEPILQGEWFHEGQHIDLIGAFNAHMREADDALLQKAEIYVDNFATTLEHIGELKIPLQKGVITSEDIRGDFYHLIAQGYEPKSPKPRTSAPTLFKNGGGAHLDLMIAHYLYKLCQ